MSGNVVDFSFFVSLYVSDLRTRTALSFYQLTDCHSWLQGAGFMLGVGFTGLGLGAQMRTATVLSRRPLHRLSHHAVREVRRTVRPLPPGYLVRLGQYAYEVRVLHLRVVRSSYGTERCSRARAAQRRRRGGGGTGCYRTRVSTCLRPAAVSEEAHGADFLSLFLRRHRR